jgi:DNA-binding SARP family transcriptional activator
MRRCACVVYALLETVGERQERRPARLLRAPGAVVALPAGDNAVLEFRILGPLEVAERDRLVVLGGPKQRALLVILLLHRGEVVSTDRLSDELWGERPPASAAKTVQAYVSNLRRALGDGLLVTRGHGYLLQAARGQLDVDQFEALVEAGRTAFGEGDACRASTRLREGLALWRGPPLADFAYEPFAQAEAARLGEERLAALEDRIDADLALGGHAALVGELESLVREHPLRERLQGQLMIALYRSGRQAEALERYQQARRKLLDELGIEPGPELQQLERAILNRGRHTSCVSLLS